MLSRRLTEGCSGISSQVSGLKQRPRLGLLRKEGRPEGLISGSAELTDLEGARESGVS